MRRSRLGGWRSGLVAVAAVAMLTGVAAVPAAAARPAVVAFTVNGYVGDRELSGDAPTGTVVKVVQRRGGKTIHTSSGKARDGRWYLGPKPLRAGDRLVVTVGAAKRVIVVPSLQLTVAAGAEVVSGRVPTSDLDFELYAQNAVGGVDWENESGPAVAQADGTFSLPIPFKLSGGDYADLAWTSPSGDRWDLIRWRNSLVARVGSARVVGYGVVPGRTTVSLRSPAGALLGSAQVVQQDGDGGFRAFLRKNGSNVKPKVGQKLRTSGVPGAVLTLRASDLAIDPAGDGTLTGTCLPGGAAIVGRVDPVEGGYDFYGAKDVAPDGTVHVENLTEGGGSPAVGSTWELRCESPAGLTEIFSYTIPTP